MSGSICNFTVGDSDFLLTIAEVAMVFAGCGPLVTVVSQRLSSRARPMHVMVLRNLRLVTLLTVLAT
jgi:hypothetical protein